MPIRTSKFNVDIITQSLSEVTVRDKSGAFHTRLGHYGPILTPAIITIINISAKGVIYGGFLTISQGNPPGDNIDVQIDGTDSIYTDIETFSQRNLVKPLITPLYLTEYDTVNNYYTLGFSSGITFEESVKVIYDCETAGAFLSYWFHYATI